jgi:cyanophycinase
MHRFLYPFKKYLGIALLLQPLLFVLLTIFSINQQNGINHFPAFANKVHASSVFPSPYCAGSPDNICNPSVGPSQVLNISPQPSGSQTNPPPSVNISSAPCMTGNSQTVIADSGDSGKHHRKHNGAISNLIKQLFELLIQLLNLLISQGGGGQPINIPNPKITPVPSVGIGITITPLAPAPCPSNAEPLQPSIVQPSPSIGTPSTNPAPSIGGPTTLTIFPKVGSAADSAITPTGPGLILMGGGTDVDAAFKWMRSTLSTDATSKLGDVVVLRATGTNTYDSYIAGMAPFNSVQTILLPPPSTPADLQQAAAIVDKAEAVFFAGGNQADYAAWAGSPLMTAVQGVYQRGGVIGGTSAGLAILGQYVYDSKTGSATSAEALANPFASSISFTNDIFNFPHMKGVITDTHFAPRDRFGRLTAFMARQIANGTPSQNVYGVGVDEQNALVIDKAGKGTLLQQTSGTGAAFIANGGQAAQVVSGKPLIYSNITVIRIDKTTQFYDFVQHCGTGTTYTLSVDGSKSPPFGTTNPYTAAGIPGTCP